MAKVIVEIYFPGRLRPAYRTFDSERIRVGRGYENDLILADPYVSAEHLVLRMEEGGWVAEDLGTKNGSFINHNAKLFKVTPVESGDEIFLGKTRFRILSPSHPVPPAVQLVDNSNIFLKLGHGFLAWGLVAVLCGINVLTRYLESRQKLPVEKLVSAPVLSLLAVFAWVCAWAFVGRLIKNRSRFIMQLSFSTLMFLFMTPVLSLATSLGYYFNNMVLEIIFFFIYFGTIFAVLLNGNLGIATYIPQRKRALISGLISTGLIGLGIFAYFAAKPEFLPRPDFYSELKPPFFKLVPSKSPEQFLAESERVFNIPEK